MPYVKIEVTREGVTRAQKRSLVRGVTALLQRELGKDPNTTFVTIDEIDTDSWGVGGELVTDRRRREAGGVPEEGAVEGSAVEGSAVEGSAVEAPVPLAPASAVVHAVPGLVSTSAEDVSRLMEAVATYLDGLYFADADRLSRVFHPRARYFSTAEGALKELDMPTYFDIVRGRTAPAATEQPRYDRLLSLDVAGPHTALVKLECALPPRHFTDYLPFVKEAGRWWIISKVFEARELRGC